MHLRWKQLADKQPKEMTVIPSVHMIGAVVRRAPMLPSCLSCCSIIDKPVYSPEQTSDEAIAAEV